ncbi:MAG: DUF3857 domain-containing protein [Bacteroidota bacterium]
MKIKKLWLSLGLLFLWSISFAQKAPMKFGKVDADQVKMTSYEHDPEAHAVILCDYGYTRFEYDTKGDRGFFMVFEREIRIKILDEAGLDWADWSIPLYKDGNTEENLSTLKGVTFNLENGKVVQEKLSKKEVFKTERSAHWDQVKFAMPKVKAGSVIDIKYTINSDFKFNLQEWQFQYDIPALWSEYRVEIPEYYHYNKTLKGYEFARMTVQDEKSRNERITFTGMAGSNRALSGGRNRAVSRSVNYDVNAYRWVVEQMPAFKEEAYMTTASNYLTAISFELSFIQFPGEPVRSFTENWESIGELLKNSDNFGGQLKKLNFLKEEVKQFQQQYPQEEERMVAIYDFVRQNMKWDEVETKYSSGSIKKAYEKGIGNSADINLLLTLLLQKSGLAAAPVVLSTRSHGNLNPAHPSVSQFDYVVAGVKIGEGYALLDATDDKRPANLLPYRALNGQGRWISEGLGQWVDVQSGGKYKTACMLEASLDETGLFKGKLSRIQKGYAALHLRKKLTGSIENFAQSLEKDYEGLTITAPQINGADDVYKDIKEEYEVSIEEQVNTSGDFKYFSPMLFFAETENPFKLDDRKYPIDYGFAINETYSMRFTIPDGYTVEELPEKAVVTLPNNAGKFIYHIVSMNNMIQVNSKFNINQPLFMATDYASLKEYYDLVIQKHAEQVVLKKKT